MRKKACSVDGAGTRHTQGQKHTLIPLRLCKAEALAYLDAKALRQAHPFSAALKAPHFCGKDRVSRFDIRERSSCELQKNGFYGFRRKTAGRAILCLPQAG